MKIWITGESSFIARNLDKWFIQSNRHEIINSLMNKKLDEYRTYNCGYVSYSDEIDIFNENLIDIINDNKPDLIIHNAAVVGTDYCTEYKDHAIKTNINGTYNIVKICNELNIPMIFFSTSVCYKPSDEILYEESFLQSSTIYGATKLACEEIIRTSLEQKHIIIIPAMLFGAHDLHSAINKLLMSGLNILKSEIQINLNVNYIKPFIYIDNFLDAVEIVINNFDKVAKQRINIGPDDSTYFADVIDFIHEVLCLNPNYNLKSNLDYLGNHVLSNTKIKSLGWNQHISLKEGIKLTYGKLKNG